MEGEIDRIYELLISTIQFIDINNSNYRYQQLIADINNSSAVLIATNQFELLISTNRLNCWYQ